MIFIIELDKDDVETMSLFRALEIIWSEIDTFDVFSYDNDEHFKDNIHEHIDDPKSDNYIFYIDTVKKIAETQNIKIDTNVVKVGNV